MGDVVVDPHQHSYMKEVSHVLGDAVELRY